MTSPRTYAGNPCSKGHDGTRYVSTRACVECMRERQAQRPTRDYSRDTRRQAKAGKVDVKAFHDRTSARYPKLLGALDAHDGMQGETLAPAPALPPLDAGQALDIRALGQALGAALVDAGRMHVAMTQLEGGLWQVVTLRPGYKGQVTRCSSDAGEALRLALQGTRGRPDELLDVVG